MLKNILFYLKYSFLKIPRNKMPIIISQEMLLPGMEFSTVKQTALMIQSGRNL